MCPLPESLKYFGEEQVSRRRCSTGSDYVTARIAARRGRHMIRRTGTPGRFRGNVGASPPEPSLNLLAVPLLHSDIPIRYLLIETQTQPLKPGLRRRLSSQS